MIEGDSLLVITSLQQGKVHCEQNTLLGEVVFRLLLKINFVTVCLYFSFSFFILYGFFIAFLYTEKRSMNLNGTFLGK